jgi:hypothetical protein
MFSPSFSEWPADDTIPAQDRFTPIEDTNADENPNMDPSSSTSHIEPGGFEMAVNVFQETPEEELPRKRYLQYVLAHCPRTRRDKVPRLRGPNRYGRRGCKRCEACRRHRQAVRNIEFKADVIVYL